MVADSIAFFFYIKFFFFFFWKKKVAHMNLISGSERSITAVATNKPPVIFQWKMLLGFRDNS
jgi:hypothetical protein